MSLNQLYEPIGHGRCDCGSSAHTPDHGSEIEAPVEAIAELGEVARQVLGANRMVVLTTNKPFGEWNAVFPNATCVVALVDRLVHRSEILAIDGDSFRLK